MRFRYCSASSTAVVERDRRDFRMVRIWEVGGGGGARARVWREVWRRDLGFFEGKWKCGERHWRSKRGFCTVENIISDFSWRLELS